MGAYRSKPITDKVSSDETGKYVKCGASSMQGWRVTQEDSHNCVIEYDENTSLFAVYDGHGGHEVAQYCSESLPQYLKECASYKKGEYMEALKEAFLGFDATLIEPKVVKVLKQIVKSACEDKDDSENQNSGSEDEENICNLYEEAQMPLEELMAKYKSDGLDADIKKLKGETPSSPFLVAKQPSKGRSSEEACSSKAGSSSSSSSSSGGAVPPEDRSSECVEKKDGKTTNGSREGEIKLTSGSGDQNCALEEKLNKKQESNSDRTPDSTQESNGQKVSEETGRSEGKAPEKSQESGENVSEKSEDTIKENTSSVKGEISSEKSEENEANGGNRSKGSLESNSDAASEEQIESKDKEKFGKKNLEEEERKGVHIKENKVKEAEKDSPVKKVEVNGDVEPSDLKKEIKNESHENGEVAGEETEDDEEEEKVSKSGKGKGKAILKKVERPTRASARQRNMAILFRSWLSAQDSADSESDDEGDESFQGAEDSSSNDDEKEEAGAEGEQEEEEEEADDEDEEDGEEEEEEDCEDEDGELAKLAKGPGVESGCTAVIALLHGRDLYVANAGDSRCIVSRAGEALDMSLDHKPEDDVEIERIVAAGGYVSYDGRINGGLNLSRAIGDHAYKQTEKLPPEEQMITALPDVRTLCINPESDEFMVLACDGIWNSMTSQEVINFVRTRLQDGDTKLSAICEELFDYCLAPDTASDGTGCDNMTAVIVQFLPVLQNASTSDVPNTSILSTTNKRPASPTDNSDSSAKRLKTDVV